MADGTAKLPNEVDRIVGALIRAARNELKMSQSDLATLLGLTFQQVQKYEKGTNRVSVGRLYEIANVLKKPISYFFDSELLTYDTAANLSAKQTIDSLGTAQYARAIRALSQISDPQLMAAAIDIVERLAQVDPLE